MVIKGGVEKEEKEKGEAQNEMSHFQINYVDFFFYLLQNRGTK